MRAEKKARTAWRGGKWRGKLRKHTEGRERSRWRGERDKGETEIEKGTRLPRENARWERKRILRQSKTQTEKKSKLDH